MANQPAPIGCPSPAPSSSSCAALPADRVPKNAPSRPPAATVARSGSLSNHSLMRSATAIGIHRSNRYASALPSARNRRPVLSSSIRSPVVGSSIDGGGVALIARRTPAIRAKLSRKRGYCSASRAEKLAISLAARRASAQRTSARRSSDGAHTCACGLMMCSPWRSSARARTIAGSIAAACASVGQRKPGAISEVIAQPPTRSARSSTSGFRPPFARNAAVMRPLWPAPMMTTSCITPSAPGSSTRRCAPARP